MVLNGVVSIRTYLCEHLLGLIFAFWSTSPISRAIWRRVTVHSRHPRVHASYFASKKDPGSLSFWYPLGTKPRWSCRCSWCAATFASTRRQRSRR